jgi:hypothetical protein
VPEFGSDFNRPIGQGHRPSGAPSRIPRFSSRWRRLGNGRRKKTNIHSQMTQPEPPTSPTAWANSPDHVTFPKRRYHSTGLRGPPREAQSPVYRLFTSGPTPVTRKRPEEKLTDSDLKKAHGHTLDNYDSSPIQPQKYIKVSLLQPYPSESSHLPP